MPVAALGSGEIAILRRRGEGEAGHQDLYNITQPGPGAECSNEWFNHGGGGREEGTLIALVLWGYNEQQL